MTTAILAACTALIAAENATAAAEENAPASPGPNATITRCWEAEQAAIDGLVVAIEGEGYVVTNATDQKAAHDKEAADEKSKRDADLHPGSPVVRGSGTQTAEGQRQLDAANAARLKQQGVAGRPGAPVIPGSQVTNDSTTRNVEAQHASDLNQQQLDAAKKPV